MNNEILLKVVKQKKPRCYEYFESNIIPKLETKVNLKKYEFETEILHSKLLDELLFDENIHEDDIELALFTNNLLSIMQK